MRMSKQKRVLAPELRFPEFTNEPGWKFLELNSVAKRLTNKNKGEKISRVLTNSATNGIMDQRDYFDKDIAIKGNLENYYVVDLGDYVYNPRMSKSAPVGPISKNKVGKGVMSPLYTVFQFKNKNNDFFEHFFKSSKWHAYLQTVSNSGARHDRMSISSSEFMAMPIPHPSEKEQQKIANCLGSLDKLIMLHTQKLDALNNHRKAMMQQLFPASGETSPKLRFPEFRNKRDWEIKPFSKLFKIGSGKDYKHLNSGDIPVYGSGGYMRSVDDYLYEGDSACIGRKGTINSPLFLTGKFWAVDTLFFTHSFKGCLPKFIYLLFQNINWLEHNEAGGVPSLSKIIINKIEVALPSEISEQQRIIDLITNIDYLIDKQTQRIDALRTHKKGLTQNLFPPMDVEM